MMSGKPFILLSLYDMVSQRINKGFQIVLSSGYYIHKMHGKSNQRNIANNLKLRGEGVAQCGFRNRKVKY